MARYTASPNTFTVRSRKRKHSALESAASDTQPSESAGEPSHVGYERKLSSEEYRSDESSIATVSQPALSKDLQWPHAAQQFENRKDYSSTGERDLEYSHFGATELNSPSPRGSLVSLRSAKREASTGLIDNIFGDLDGDSCWEDDEPLEQNVCFGVLLMDIECPPTDYNFVGSVPANLQGLGDFTKITIQESGRYAGLLKKPLIRQLLEDENVQLNAILCLTAQRSHKNREWFPAELLKERLVRVVLCGVKQDGSRLGTMLSKSDLYLQQPFREECGDLEYCNPHFLVRPGGSMPLLKSSTDVGTENTAQTGILDEINKSRIMQIFNLAHSGGSHVSRSEGLLSRRLKSALKDHQITALAMMVGREWNTVELHNFPSLWEKTGSSETPKSYRNAITRLHAPSPSMLSGGVLADDMGLGKTLTSLALICLSLDSRIDDTVAQRTLVVTPKSTLPGWQSQIERHIHRDQLRVRIYHGSNRPFLMKDLDNQDVVLTTYETLRSDCNSTGYLLQNEWYRIILDEAHHIRNRSSQAFRAVCTVKSRHRWCLTGTPIHNSLDDYGALLSFLGVPTFGAKGSFDSWITRPIREKKSEGLTRLQALVRATCLRRTKESIGDTLDFPPRTEIMDLVELHHKDQELYDFFKKRTMKLAAGLSAEEKSRSAGPNEGNILSSLNFLRLICCHGERLLPESALTTWNSRDQDMMDCDNVISDDRQNEKPEFSAKIEALINNLRSSHSLRNNSGLGMPSKSVVFSYWTKMLDLIQEALHRHGFQTCRIDGGTSLDDRRFALKSFNEDRKCTVMLASIGSAGEGLDLTVANNVHLMEPHWNPMAEAQAVDRVYRIGQVRQVFVTRYIVPSSIETYIQWVQQQKLKLVSQFVDTEGPTQTEIDMERWKRLRENLGWQG